MDVFAPFLQKINQSDHRLRIEDVLKWVLMEFPQLEPHIKWNQPMFTDHGTFIISFSFSSKNLLVAPEVKTLDLFTDALTEVGYKRTKQLIQIPWAAPIHYDLLRKIITFNIEDKADLTTFWR